MNSGISDAFLLGSKILDGLSPTALQEYNQERSFAVRTNFSEAEKLYARSLEIASTLGLDIKNLRMLEGALESLNRPGVGQAVFGPIKKIASLFLEVDSIGAHLGSTLRSKQLHIPLVLPEHEFQERVAGREILEELIPLGWRKLWGNRLAPNAPVKLWRRTTGSTSSTEISLRLIPTELITKPMPTRVVFGSSSQRIAINEFLGSLGIDRFAFIEIVDECDFKSKHAPDGMWTAKDQLLNLLGDNYPKESDYLMVMRLDGIFEGLFLHCIK